MVGVSPSRIPLPSAAFSRSRLASLSGSTTLAGLRVSCQNTRRSTKFVLADSSLSLSRATSSRISGVAFCAPALLRNACSPSDMPFAPAKPSAAPFSASRPNTVCSACSRGLRRAGRSEPGAGGRSLNSGGIVRGSRETTRNSSGGFLVSPTLSRKPLHAAAADAAARAAPTAMPRAMRRRMVVPSFASMRDLSCVCI